MPSSSPRSRRSLLGLGLIIWTTLQQHAQVQAFVISSGSSSGSSITPGPSRWQRQASRIALYSAPPNGFYGNSFQRKSCQDQTLSNPSPLRSPACPLRGSI